MIYLANFFIDVANVLFVWLPFLSYILGICCGIGFVACLLRVSSPSSARGDGAKLIFLMLACAMFLSLPAVINGANATFGLDARAETGGQLNAFLQQAPNINAATPQALFQEMIGIFMPFFRAVGACCFFGAVLSVRDADSIGLGVKGRIFKFVIAGTILMNLNTLVQMIMGNAGA